jgi:hypothetical protein
MNDFQGLHCKEAKVLDLGTEDLFASVCCYNNDTVSANGMANIWSVPFDKCVEASVPGRKLLPLRLCVLA